VLYITHTRLMLESEHAVRQHARSPDEIPHRICSQLLADPGRYSHWYSRHDVAMGNVAHARRRERQLLRLRSVAVEQVHRTALVRYLRDHRIVGAARDQTLRTFNRLSDAENTVLAEHRGYVIAASTQLCATDLLALIGDERGEDLIRSYELAYGQYFAMFCGRARARQMGEPYLLSALLPEVKAAAERMRRRALDAQSLGGRPVSLLGTRLPAAPRKGPVASGTGQSGIYRALSALRVALASAT
jgi:hypothetical protein